MFDIFLIIKSVKIRYYLNRVYKNYYELHKIVKNFCSIIKLKIQDELHRYNYSHCLFKKKNKLSLDLNTI